MCSNDEARPMISKRISVPGVEALRVRRRGDEIGLVLIDGAGAVQVIPVQLEPEQAASDRAA